MDFENLFKIFFFHREAKQADVPEGGRLSVTCIASGAKPQAYIYWNSEPKLNNTTVRFLKYIFFTIRPHPKYTSKNQFINEQLSYES